MIIKTLQQHRRILVKSSLFLLLICGGIWAYHRYQHQNTAAQPHYLTAPVQKGSISYQINATGIVYPEKIVDVGAQVSGKIARLHVKIGDTVTAGQIVVEIDAKNQENMRKTATAQLQRQKAELASAKAHLQQAQKNEQRSRKLFQNQAGSKIEYEQNTTALTVAENNVRAAEAAIRQSELTIELADVQLSDTKIRAPISGTVIAIAVEEGQTVNAAQSSPLLITLAQTNTMIVKAEIAEADIGDIRAGLPAKIHLLGKKAQSYQAPLNHIDPAPISVSQHGAFARNEAVYYYADIKLPNPENKLRYGMTAKIAIEVERAEKTLLVPLTALHDDEDGTTSVNVLTAEQQPQKRIVKTGLEDGINAQIVSGLTEGENVIISTSGTGAAYEFKKRGL